jgi:hypothetical protein
MNKIKTFILKKFLIYDFYNLSVIKRLESPFFKTVENNNTSLPVHFEPNPNQPNINNGLHYVSHIPPYFKTEINSNLKYRSLYYFIGFLADIKEYESLEAYMKKQFGSKSRGKVRSYCKRLDICFKTSYKLYHGNIEKQDYQRIIEALEVMIKRRFNQRGEEHQADKDWEYYKETTYQFILDKKASLFVIYDNNKPIDICLNYHYDTIMINYIRAFDIDYSKFRLGYIDIFKQLEWCFENNYTTFDLSAGVFSYKKQWCNVTYKFRNDIVCNKKSFFNNCLVFFTFILLKIKLFLNSKNIITDKVNSNRDISKTNNKGNSEKSTPYSFTQNELDSVKRIEDAIKIDIEQPNYKFLRQTIYEYLYLNFENKNNITVYKINSKENSYVVNGKKSIMLS